MGAMYRLKAYFGMVPAEELGDYVDDADRYGRRSGRESSAWGRRYEREYERDDYDGAEFDEPDAYAESDGYDTGDYERAESYEPGERYSDDWDRAELPRRDGIGRETASSSGPRAVDDTISTGSSSVRGALAVDARAAREEFPRAEREPDTPLPEQRDRKQSALARITTLQPRSYYEARTIGERYRDGVPVIMNLTELDDAAARRLVDFAAGLAFALRGSIDKVTNRVFLLTPADVEVSAEDARRIAGARLSSAEGRDDRYGGEN